MFILTVDGCTDTLVNPVVLVSLLDITGICDKQLRQLGHIS